MSCCCCSPEGAGITLGGVVFVVAVALIATHLAAVLHFLLMVLIGTLALGTILTVVAALTVWKVRNKASSATARYTVEQVPDRAITGQVF